MERVALGIDGASHSGIGVWRVGAPLTPVGAGHVGGFVAARGANVMAAGWSETKAIATLDELLGEAEWIAALERSWGSIRKRAGENSAPPTYAQTHWLRVIAELARVRAKRAEKPFRAPIILRPVPNQWRGPLGLPVRIKPKDTSERARREAKEGLKVAAIERLKGLGIEIESHDVAEGVQIAEWLSRIAAHPFIPQRNKPVLETRFVP